MTQNNLGTVLRALGARDSGTDKLDSKHVAEQLTTKGQVTALGSVVSEVGQQFGSGRLAGVVVFSDFAHNSGIAPLGSSENSPVSRLGVPIFVCGRGHGGSGPVVDLQTEPKMKRPTSSVLVKLRRAGCRAPVTATDARKSDRKPWRKPGKTQSKIGIATPQRAPNR
jgi:hypothetical protein